MRVRAFLLAAVVAGLAVLGAACGGGGEDTSPTPTAVPAQDYTELTGEQAIQRVLEMLEAVPGNRPDPSTATATSIKDCETVDVMRWEGGQWGSTPDNPSERPAWLVKIRGEFPGIMAGGLDRDTTPRSGTLIWVLKTNGLGGTIRFDERQHEGPELSAEDIVQRVLYELDSDPTTEGDPGLYSATATPMTEREALEALERAGGAPDLSMRVLTDDPAWLVEVRGESVDSCTLAPLQGRYLSVRYPDGSPVSSGFIPEAAATPGPAVELTREEAIERAFELLANYLFFQPDPSTATATRTTFGEALETVLREGAPPDGASGLSADLPVWLVEVRGTNVKVGAPARYVFILNLHGGSEYDEQILGAMPTASGSPTPSPEASPSPEAIATLVPSPAATAIATSAPTPSPPPTIYDLIEAGDLVIYGGTLIDGTGADPLPNAVVVVHEKRITVVAQEPVFHPPPDTQAVNARGGTIMPGVIDSHAHITGDIGGPDGLSNWLEEGVTTLRDIASIARPADLLRKVMLREFSPQNVQCFFSPHQHPLDVSR